MHYRPEIDGLRAVAVLPVLMFHAHVPGFSGGYIGVDVFFVISGFLITTLLLQDLEQGRLSLRGFYGRRARRILPALIVMLLATLPFAWMWMLPSQLADFGKHLVATVFFMANVVRLLLDGSYFDTLAETKPLLHVWSLSVEEQFYFAYPLALIVLWRLPRRWLVPALALCAAISFAMAVWAVEAKPRAAYYLLPTRAWELLAGALAATVCLRATFTPRPALALSGLAAILFAVVWLDEDSGIPGLAALLPVLGSVAILIHARAGSLTHRLLAFRPLVGIGLISYSLYLWHQPVLAFARLRLQSASSPWPAVGLLVLVFALSWASWRFVERPFRRDGFALWPSIGLAGATAAVVVFAGLVTVWQGAFWRFPTEVQDQIGAADWSHRCLFQTSDGPITFPQPDCVFGDGGRKVAVVGDSLAASLMPGIFMGGRTCRSTNSPTAFVCPRAGLCGMVRRRHLAQASSTEPHSTSRRQALTRSSSSPRGPPSITTC
jgi:peptidoglycan/LPS O-acetylase OafA/YrhL